MYSKPFCSIKIYFKIFLGILCHDLQWDPVPDSFNLEDDPNDCIRTDTLINHRPSGARDEFGVVPWTISKLFL